jgi:intracellular septation protein
MNAVSRPAPPGWLKPTVDYVPLAVFFVVYLTAGLIPATGVLIVVTVVAVLLSVAMTRRIPWMPVITAVVVAIFGGLTLWFNDDRFIKMKPTIVQAIMAAILLGGLALRRPLLKPLMSASWPMDDRGWNKLTFRFALFFAAMAVINEIVWRTQSTDFWVTFKVFGILGLTLVFSVAQAPLLNRHALAEESAEGADP